MKDFKIGDKVVFINAIAEIELPKDLAQKVKAYYDEKGGS